jgi:hypothetical protein
MTVLGGPTIDVYTLPAVGVVVAFPPKIVSEAVSAPPEK